MRILKVLLVICCVVHGTAGFDWTSSGSLPDGTTVQACPDQEVTLPWSFSLAAGEHLTNVEWHFTPPGGQETLLATQVMGNFVSGRGAVQNIHFIPNAGLHLTHLTTANTGVYTVYVDVDLHGSLVRQMQTVNLRISDMPLTTDGELHVQMLDNVVYVNATRQYHAQIACGNFLSFWGSTGVSVYWKTPTNQTLSSSFYDNGRFLLHVPNPVVSGEYSCTIDTRSPAGLCLAQGSPLRRGAAVSVDGVQTELRIMNTRMSEFQAREEQVERENSALKQELQALRQDNAQLKSDLTSKIQAASRSVSFHAWRNRWQHTLNSGDAVIFEHVVTNEGNAYNGQTGVFTVPVDGTYAFFFTVVTDETSPTIDNTDAGLYADNTLLASTYSSYDSGHHESGTGHAIVSLRTGQQVFVRNLNSDARYYPTYSTFTGALLHAAVN